MSPAIPPASAASAASVANTVGTVVPAQAGTHTVTELADAAHHVVPAQAGTHTTPEHQLQQIWTWLNDVADPEIPVISIVDLGIVRDVQVAPDGVCSVTITPTYSGCPAMQVIADAITTALHGHGIANVRLINQLSPAWTTDWMSAAGKAKLRGYGIAPPAQQVIDTSRLRSPVSRQAQPALLIACPNCGSTHTEVVSQFGSTPCKALYKCLACREPFDYFKCH